MRRPIHLRIRVLKKPAEYGEGESQTAPYSFSRTAHKRDWENPQQATVREKAHIGHGLYQTSKKRGVGLNVKRASACGTTAKRGIGVLATAALCLSFAFAMGIATTQAMAEETAQGTAVIELNDFQQHDAGALMDAYNIDAKVNDGSRGCDACHTDLQATVENLAPTVHIMATGPIFGKTADWNDCESCHSMHNTRGGVYLADFMHSTHFSSAAFTDACNGTCWSCHATTREGEIVMYDEYVYSVDATGYVEFSTPEDTIESSTWFFRQRNYDADSSIGVSILSADEVDFTATLDQATSPEEERFDAVNYDIPEWTEEDFANWTIDIKGVNNPQSFTLAQLDELFEKHTTQVTSSCLVNGVNASMECSYEASGYLLADIVEYCGGIVDGAQTIMAAADPAEGWWFCITLEDAMNNGAFIATEYYGHPLTAVQGAPATFVAPGYPGACSVKYLTSIEFGTTDITAPLTIVGSDDLYAGKTDPHIYSVNSAWFNPARDGETYKVGETISLEGYGRVWNLDGHYCSGLRFSWDYGKTWIYVDADADSDPNNWQRFYGTWTPTEAGTYCLKVEAVDGADGWHQKKSASVFITVEE